ncbi:MAG: type III-B CRISPR module RAMP protein Cmr4 [Saprospiraceae bacterium]|nr:type III-B CRISPR module RAMP protein Cmr4 [Saprospiraceae bacterium]MDW8485081.1 type III-B CRISPR module RAMP protein Cmr4 [Saprospiraceae bacterium]
MSHTPDYFRALLGLRTLTPLHAGVAGGSHILDRPIHRDVHTQLPKISSNALKGALREYGLAKNAEELFGKTDVSNGGSASGCLNFTDVRLLFFPVRSAVGGWAWVTSPSVLHKFWHEAKLTGHGKETDASRDFFAALGHQIGDSAVYAGQRLASDKYLILQNYSFPIDKRLEKNQVESWQCEVVLLKSLEALAEHLVIVSDENLREFTLRYTEIHVRNKIHDATRATGGGLLFSEEHLPANTVLYALAFSMPDREQQEIENKLSQQIRCIRIGGNASLGKGFCTLNWYFPSNNHSLSS